MHRHPAGRRRKGKGSGAGGWSAGRARGIRMPGMISSAAKNLPVLERTKDGLQKKCFLKKNTTHCSLFKPISRLKSKSKKPSDTKVNAETPHKGKDFIQEMYTPHNCCLCFAENTRMLVKWGDPKPFRIPPLSLLLLFCSFCCLGWSSSSSN